MPRICTLAIVTFLSSLSVAGAQSNKGGLNGTVLDESGAVVAGATVVITNIDTAESQELKTSTSGTFSAPLLDPVEFRVTAAFPGFRTTTVTRVKVDTVVCLRAIMQQMAHKARTPEALEAMAELERHLDLVLVPNGKEE